MLRGRGRLPGTEASSVVNGEGTSLPRSHRPKHRSVRAQPASVAPTAAAKRIWLALVGACHRSVENRTLWERPDKKWVESLLLALLVVAFGMGIDRDPKQRSATSELRMAEAMSQKAEMSNLYETQREDVRKESSHELGGFLLPAICEVLKAKSNLTNLHGN